MSVSMGGHGMGSSPILLAVSSGLVLLGLIVHSVWALPRRRALAFWGSVFVYGLARGFAVRLLSRDVLGASVPYVLHAPSMRVLGVSVQELAGWAIVCYLGWWLGWRFSAGLARPVLGGRFARGDGVARHHRPRGSARHARPDAVSSRGS